MELLIFRNIIDENATPLQALSFLKNVSSSFPNIEVAIRIMLTIPVTSAGAERSFSKLKLIKNYLRSNLSQHKLSDLALISIEYSIADSLSYDETIALFASKKARKKIFK